ncbi:hypothetical protein WMY93_023721 [Mugilogobius chulae]|uniref:Uncharacterized protein n=1 Tax=Mugilogobius chulae TaxID=88201 RepID=A0AAW0NFL5_9GOBI
MAAAACAPPPPSSPDRVSLLAAASGRCPPLAPGTGGAGSGALDPDLPALPAALQEHATLMSTSMLLNPRQKTQNPPPPDCEFTRNVLSANHSAAPDCDPAPDVLPTHCFADSDCDYLLCPNRNTPTDSDPAHYSLSSNHDAPFDCESARYLFPSNPGAAPDLSTSHNAPSDFDPSTTYISSNYNAAPDFSSNQNTPPSLSSNHSAAPDPSPNHNAPSDLSSNQNAPMFEDEDSIERLRISSLFAAAQNGQTDFVEELLSVVSADVTDLNGFSPLHFAAAHGHSSCVSALLSFAADVNAVSSGGLSALFVASEAGQTHCVRLMLESGADRNICTHGFLRCPGNPRDAAVAMAPGDDGADRPLCLLTSDTDSGSVYSDLSSDAPHTLSQDKAGLTLISYGRQQYHSFMPELQFGTWSYLRIGCGAYTADTKREP